MTDEATPTEFSALLVFHEVSPGVFEARKLRGTNDGAALVTPSGISGIFQQGELVNPTSARVAYKTTVWLVGAVAVYLNYYSFGTPTGKELRVVFNAVDDTDADAKAASVGTRTCIPLGKDLERSFPTDDACIRMDIYADAGTEAGAKAYWEATSP